MNTTTEQLQQSKEKLKEAVVEAIRIFSDENPQYDVNVNASPVRVELRNYQKVISYISCDVTVTLL